MQNESIVTLPEAQTESTDIVTARMPECDVDIMFSPGPHEYRLSFGTPWSDSRPVPSVTQFVGHYCPKFDAETQAARTAARKGLTPAALLAEWRAAGDKACAMGTRVHANQERMMHGQQPIADAVDEREAAIGAAGVAAMNAIIAAGWRPAAAERMVASYFYRLAGTVDAIFQRGGEVMLADWKTNAAIKRDNAYGVRCLPPISHLPDCEYARYSLQLNLYERILKRDGYYPASTPIRMFIVHLTPDGFVAMPVERTPDVEILLADYLSYDWYSPLPPF